MTTATYMRVSSTAQADANGVDAQRSEIVRYLDAYGMIATEYVDSGWSGKDQDRPEWQRLLEDIRQRRITAVVAYSMSRLSRSVRDILSFYDLCDRHGVRVVLLKDAVDTHTPAGRMMRTVLAAFVEFERERIAESIRAGVRAARARGKKWGYGTTQPVRSVPAQQLRRAAELRGSGMKPSDVARELGVSERTVRKYCRMERKERESHGKATELLSLPHDADAGGARAGVLAAER